MSDVRGSVKEARPWPDMAAAPVIATLARWHAGTPARGERLGVIVSQFPELHETFIARELSALKGAGIPLRIYSLKRCRDRIVHPEALALREQTAYLAWDDVRVWASAVRELVRHPVRGLAALGWTVRSHAWPVSVLGKALMVWVQAMAIARQMRADGVAHLHAHWAMMPTTAAVIVSRWLSIPFSFSAHAWDLFVRNPSLQVKVRLATQVITCTDYNRRYLTRLCAEAKEKIVLNYHGVDLEKFARLRVNGLAGSDPQDTDTPARQHVSTSAPLLLSVGRLVETKGFETLIEAYRLLRERGLSFRAVIVGEGPLHQALEQQIQASQLLECVELRPSLEQDELKQLYGQAFAFVLPCVVAKNGDRDGLPNVILEAMAMGVPVVSTAISGIPEAVQDECNGLLVAPEDPVALADAMESLIRRPAWAQALGDQGWQWARTQFNANEHMSRLVSHMKALLTSRVDEFSGLRVDALDQSTRQRANAQTRQPIKVMSIIWSLGLGGAEQVVIRLAAGLDRKRFVPLICCLNAEGPFAQRARLAGIEVMALGKRGRYDAAVLWKLIRVMRSRRIDVVHTHLWGANFWGRIAARCAGVPTVVATEHNVDTWKKPYHFVIDRFLARWTTRLVAVSQQVREFYESHGIGLGRWRVLYNGVDATAATPRGRGPVYQTLGIVNGEPVVGWIGRLVPAKAPEVFLEAIASASSQFPALKALIIGEGPLRQVAEAQVRQLGLQDRVVLTGMRHDVPDLLAGMDALIFSSEREGLSLAMLEAMAAGVPVIATAVGGTPELIKDGITGLLVPPGQPQELAHRLVELLRDPVQADGIRQAARARVAEHFSLRRMIEAHEAAYEEMFAGLRVSPFARSTILNTPTRQRANSPTRVCYIIDDLGVGGAQRQLMELVKALPKERYEPRVISLSTEKVAYAETLRKAEIPLTLIPQAGTWSWSTLWRLYRTIRAEQPAVVHTWLFTADLYGRLAAWLARTPVIVSAVRNVDLDKPWHYVAVDRLLRHVTDAFTVNADAVGEILQRRERVVPSRIRTIYNGVNLDTFNPAQTDGAVRGNLGIEPRAPLIGVIGRCVPQKDQETFLRAAALVRYEAPEAHFVIVGHGPLRQELRRVAGTLALDGCVHFLDPQVNVQAIMASLDLVVVSSRYEGCCNVILEAMAMAKPVIATAVGGNPELVLHGQTGLLVPPADPQALAEAMRSLLADPGRAQSLGRCARARAEEQFTLERMVQETTQVYERLLATAR